MTISVKVHTSGRELLVAACDDELLGQTFRSGKLKLHVSRGFYEGQMCDEAVFISRLEMATMANLVGRRTVEAATRHGFVDADRVLVIEGVPHAQMARMI
jgi:hypothetical protein